MKKQIIFIYIAVAIVLFIAIYKNNQKIGNVGDKQNAPISQDQKTDKKTQIANPASTYCKEQGGTSEIRTLDDGSQYGVCVFKNGSECEEWDFMAGRCAKDGSNFCGQSTNSPCKENQDCVAGGCSGQICGSKTEDAGMTTCEMKDCYDNNKYGLSCQCKDSQCQWMK